MWFLLLAACAGPDDGVKDTGGDTSPATLVARLTPSPLNFGSVPVGAPAVATFTVHNDGTADFGIDSVVPSTGALDATFLPTSISPGGSGDVTVTWEPASNGSLAATIRVGVDSFEAGSDELTLSVSGIAGGPVIEASTSEVTLGSVYVGCSSTEALTLHNGGDLDLVIDSASFLETEDLHLLLADGAEPPALPWSVAAGADLDLLVAYSPLDVQDISDVLRIHSNDQGRPTLDVRATAVARASEAVSIEFPAVHEQYLTMVWAVNTVAVHGMFAEPFLGALPVLFETLNDTGIPYRVAFVVDNNGRVAGDEPYLDESWTPEDAAAAAEVMLAPAGGDLDTIFQTLDNAVTEGRSWLIDEDDDWLHARLVLVDVNNDIEQSSGNYVTWVAAYRAYKTDPDDVVVSAFGGDVPRGCTGADPAQAFYDAATLTGGKFYSICEENWTKNMAELAVSSFGDGYQEFPLEAAPLEWTIKVYLDGVRQTTGWDYDDEKNIVTFWEGWQPAVGTIVRVDYIAVPECPDAE